TFSYPFPSNATTTQITFSGGIVGSLTGNADTATALAANPTNCSAGNYPLGVDAQGNAESCTAASGGSSFSYPFPSNATTTAITFSGGIVGDVTGDLTGNAGTVTNGVYTTTFNSLFDPRFITDLAATTSVKSITTLPSLSLPYSQLTGTPSTFSYPFPSNAT